MSTAWWGCGGGQVQPWMVRSTPGRSAASSFRLLAWTYLIILVRILCILFLNQLCLAVSGASVTHELSGGGRDRHVALISQDTHFCAYLEFPMMYNFIYFLVILLHIEEGRAKEAAGRLHVASWSNFATTFYLTHLARVWINSTLRQPCVR